MSSEECFVLELVIDNLSNTPVFIDSVLTAVAANMKEVSYRRSTMNNYRNYIFNYHEDVEDSTPLLKEEKNPNLKSTKLSIIPEFKFEIEQDVQTDSCKNTGRNVGCTEDKMTPYGEDTTIDLQEIAMPAPKKKKKKKNLKIANNNPEDCKNSQPNGKKEKRDLEAPVGESVVIEADKTVEADSTVVSFLDSYRSQDWLGS